MGTGRGAIGRAVRLLILLSAPVAAQAPGARVLPVLYLPADAGFEPERLRLQVEAVRDAQAWYARRLGGVTFYADPLVVQRSAHPFAELAGSDFQNWWPLPAAEFASWGQSWNEDSRIKLLLLAQGAGAWAGADSENGGILAEAEAGESRAGWLGGLAVVGDSSLGGMLAGVCPRRGEASWQKPTGGTEWWCNWNTYRGTVAHELGHTFGLPHPDAFRAGFRCDSTVITNMQCHWAWPADSLLPFEAAHLRSIPVFGAGAADEWRAAEPASWDAGTRRSFTAGSELLWLQGRGNGTGYLWGTEVVLHGDPGTTIPYDAPAGARGFVVDVGWLAPGNGAVEYRVESGDEVREGRLGAADAPRTLVIPVHGTRVSVHVRGPAEARIGFGHARWLLRWP